MPVIDSAQISAVIVGGLVAMVPISISLEAASWAFHLMISWVFGKKTSRID